MYKLWTPYMGLLYYDTIFIGVNACPREQFDNFNSFRFDDLPEIASRSRFGKVQFYLTDRAPDYRKYEYLQPILEEFKPIHLVAATTRRVRSDKFPFEFDRRSESTTDLPKVRSEIIKHAKRNHISVEVSDATTCYTLQELYYYGHSKLAELLLSFLESDPAEAIPLIWDIRRLVVDPNDPGIDFPFAFDGNEFRHTMLSATAPLHRSRISQLPDVGQVIAELLSFPVPKTWDQLRWCEENLDLRSVRRAFRVIENDPRVRDTDLIEAAVREAWRVRASSVSSVKDGVLWGASLTMAVVGTFITQPTIGLLAALGLAAAQNVWLEPASRGTARLVRPQSYHVWKADQQLGRRLPPAL